MAVAATEELEEEMASLGTTSWVAFSMAEDHGLIMSWTKADSPLLKPLADSCVLLADVAAPILTEENIAKAMLNREPFVVLNAGTAAETPLDDALIVLIARAFIVREEGELEQTPEGAPEGFTVTKTGYRYKPVDVERAWRVMILDAAERRIVASWGEFCASFDECEEALLEHMESLAQERKS